MTTTSTNNPVHTIHYASVSATGLLSAGPFSDSATAGTYYVTISSITLSVFGVDTVFTSIATVPVNSFALVVTDGCANAVIAPTAQSDLSFTVFASL